MATFMQNFITNGHFFFFFFLEKPKTQYTYLDHYL